MEDLANKFQCPGCISGLSTSDCDKGFEKTETFNCGACKNHYPATHLGLGGKVCLGMPKGFNKVGPNQAFFR